MHRAQQQNFAALLCLILSLALVLAAAPAALAANAVVAPPIDSIDLAGKQVNPLHAHPGEPVVLIFIRTDCPVSNRYAPTLQKLSAEYAGKVAFWLVYPDKAESAAAIERHLHDYNYKIPALRDPRYSLVKLSEVQITPEAAVFNPSGQLVYHGRIDNWYQDFGRARPAPTTHELDDAIRAVLDGKKPAVATAAAVGCYISDLE
ncbi:MAG: redoxin domain-containing protein [Candidatus Korobacteraceae bacterium]